MADLVVGLSKAVVVMMLAKVGSAILEDADLRQKAERDLKYIMGEFEMMEAFLEVANETSVKNKLVMTWVRNVRELAYDLEDCIEVVVHLDNKRIFWRRMIPKALMTRISPLPLDQAVAELGDLKARADDLSKRYSRYSSITDSAGSKVIMTLEQPATSAAVGTSGLNRLVEAREAAARRDGFVDLASLIAKKTDVDLQAVSLWGTNGDLGKPSIIWKIYNDPTTCQNFDCRAWVKLMHPFNAHEFIRRFMTQVYANTSTHVSVQGLTRMEDTYADLLEVFVQIVNQSRYFIVLEDLVNMADWDAIRAFLPDSDRKTGSWIVVSTPQFEIASLCMGLTYQVIELEKFSANQSVYAFFNENFAITHTDDFTRFNVDRKRLDDLTSLAAKYYVEDREAKASQWMRKYPLIGRESEMNDLRRHTSKGGVNSVQVVSLWGIVGVGKSALAQSLFCDMIRQNKFHNYCWVDVSHPLDLRSFCSSLLQDSTSSTTRFMSRECRQLLEAHQFIVVIDDLQSKEEWDLLKSELLSEACKGIIVVITTEESIARHCCGDNDELMFNVTCLEDMAASELFYKEVQRNDNPPAPIELHGIAEVKELIWKCGGFPKVIVVIAHLLATTTLTLIDTVKSLNGNFINHLETKLEFYSLQCLFRQMHSTLYNLLDSIKPCIFYLSFFPPDHTIRRRRLIRRWIAEGYSMDKNENSAEEEGENNFSELLGLTVVQQRPQQATSTFSNDTRMVLCRVNGFIREYIISRRMEENLVLELRRGCTLPPRRIVRHLIILDNWERDNRVVFESMDLWRLRSLTVFGEWKSFFISRSMKVLRVLDLEDAYLNDEDLEKIVKLLGLLKFLSLRGITNITCLPSLLGDLRLLETLDVRGTSIRTLPSSTSKLQKLQYIRAGATFHPAPLYIGVKVPKGIGRMTALHTLGVVNVADSGAEGFVEDLRDLTQLRKLGVSGINRENVVKVFSAINGHGHLESLSVQIKTGNEDCLEALNGNGGTPVTPLLLENLRSLKLYGLNDRLPEWTIRPSKLAKVHLEMATLTESQTTMFLDDLPQLRVLRIKLLRDGMLHFHLAHEKVKVLEIICAHSFGTLHVTFGSSTMEKLELLKVDCCGGSPSYEFSGLKNLKGLKRVLLHNAPNVETSEGLERQLADHPNKPAVELVQLPTRN